MNNASLKTVLALCLTTLFFALPTSLQAEEAAAKESDDHVIAISIDAEITEVNHETREVTLKGPTGQFHTITVGPDVVRLEDFAVGDIVSTTYIASLEGELRKPTEAEIAEPWVELDVAEGAPR